MVVLEKKYSNREYCCRAHTEKAYRRKKEHEWELKSMEEFNKNGCLAG